MRNDFCAFILTHGRPDRVYTYDTIRSHGYTGRVYFVVDDQDKALERYIEHFGAERVLVFSKPEIASTFDEGDNFGDRRAIIYARNACFELARQIGCRYFVQLDDDYLSFYHRFNGRNEYGGWAIVDLDAVFSTLLDYYLSIPAITICMSQGGDHGSAPHTVGARRKAMNTFICSIDRPLQFFGRINEDVNTYTTLGRRGVLFLTILSVQVNQQQTQESAGGMTDLYLESGTYVKSFYSVMYSPSCVSIGEMGSTRRRIHHQINWLNAAVKILSEEHRRV